MTKFAMQPIPDGAKRGWTVKIDGKEQKVSTIELESNFGTLTHGLRPEGYDGWVFREAGGGGAVTIPYVSYEYGDFDKFFVGLVREKRANMGEEPVWCAIGGFLDAGETHAEAQAREAAEEAGLDATKARELPGPGVNANRAFFVADAATEGVRIYGLKIYSDILELPDPNDNNQGWKLKEGIMLQGFKKSGDVRFFSWRTAVCLTADALALAAIAKLAAMLIR